MIFNNEDGVALVIVLLLLTIGGILVPVLMNTSSTHIKTAKHKEATSKSFYAADSGVELVKANINDIDFSDINFDKIEDDNENYYEYLDSDDINDLKFEDNKDNWFGKGDFDFGDEEVQEIQFRIKVIGKDPITLVSKGKYAIFYSSFLVIV